MEPNLEFCSIACNKVNQGLDLNLTIPGSIIYASGSLLSILKSDQGQGGLQTLKGHKSTITTLVFTTTNKGDFVITGSADKTIILWECKNSNWGINQILTDHKSSIVSLGCPTPSIDSKSDFIFASACSSNEIKIWEFKNNQIEVSQSIVTKPHITMALSFGALPGSNQQMLFSGGTDHKLHVYVQKDDKTKFVEILAVDGHQDWIRSIKTIKYTGNLSENQKSGFIKDDLIIATGSQDKYIRIWKVSKQTIENRKGLEEMSILEKNQQLSTKSHLFQENSVAYTFMLDAVLMGHNDWVFTVNFHPVKKYNFKDGVVYDQPMILVSSSSDKTIIVWYPDSHSESWIPKDRVGEVGGTTYGFYGGLLSSDGQYLYSNGYNGSIHIWKRYENGWNPLVGVSGHSKSVEELQWDPTGKYLLTTSLDQTSRIFSTFKTDSQTTWHEISRSQIHGYDLHSCAFIKNYQYISGADEKVLRVFDAPKTFAETLENLTKIKENETILNSRPVGANLPALGLSNKAVYYGEAPPATLDVRLSESATSGIQNASITSLHQPPFEEHLVQNTLWPETAKLYGHGYEIIKVAANRQGTLVASCAKATKAEHASVRIWDTDKWIQLGNVLEYHTLTVTCLRFTNCGGFLLSAGRDRSWALFDLRERGNWKFVHGKPKCHSRIIWGVDFTPDDLFFATGSRDKTVFKANLGETMGYEKS
jgi:elongator complex protein 2